MNLIDENDNAHISLIVACINRLVRVPLNNLLESQYQFEVLQQADRYFAQPNRVAYIKRTNVAQ